MLHEFTFPSYNERDKVQAWIYVPATDPVGIVQLVHGFGEHSRRYFHMIVRYLEAGFIVAADDHVGHGKTAELNGTWGDWGDKGPETMVEDEKRLMDIVKEKYPDLPYFFFGHSMGSVITRQFVARYGAELAGATICGTCGSVPKMAEARPVIEKLVADGKGNEASPKATVAMMGWMSERIPDAKLGNEWICHDPYVQVDHANDPFDGFTKPTLNKSLLDFMKMIDDITGVQWAERVPTELPIYSIAGDEDPFGLYGQGVYEASNWLADTGHDITTLVYPGYRHEIHNYADLKDEVCDGVIEFMLDAIADDMME